MEDPNLYLFNILEARVTARNRAAKIANDLYNPLANVFLPYIGQKIEKADGNLLAKIEKKLPELPHRVYRDSAGYFLQWQVSVSESFLYQTAAGETMSRSVYESVMLTIGDTRDGILERIRGKSEARTDWTASEIIGLRYKFEKAKKKYEEARSALSWFGESDR